MIVGSDWSLILWLWQAQQSRQKYLASHMIKVVDDEEEALKPPPTPADIDDEPIYTLHPPPGPKPKEMLQPLDITPFLT